jgi:hypothetical protein
VQRLGGIRAVAHVGRLHDSLVVENHERGVCLDVEGVAVCSFNLTDVSVYTSDLETAELVKSEVCDEETTTTRLSA